MSKLTIVSDWLKGVLCLTSIVALSVLPVSASDIPGFPDIPDDPFGPSSPADNIKTLNGAEPILYFLESYMPGDSAVKIAEYTDWIRDDNENYEAYVNRGLTRLMSLAEIKSVKTVFGQFCIGLNDDVGDIDIFRRPFFDFESALRNNSFIDDACENAVPVLKDAIADFEEVQKNWAGSVDFQYMVTSISEWNSIDETNVVKGVTITNYTDMTVCFDYADTLVARALCCELISTLYLMKGYNMVSADNTPKTMDLDALVEAQRWMRAAAEMVNEFVAAEEGREDRYKDHFFELDTLGRSLLKENAQKFVDLPYWTVRLDFGLLPELLFRNGPDRTANKMAKRDMLFDYLWIDMTFRNVFEGKLGTDGSTFPEIFRGRPRIDDALTDPTFAGTLPGMSRMDLAEILSSLAESEVLEDLPDNPDEEIAHYGILYDLPEGAENNPGNPATFSSDLEYAIQLLNPTMAGFDFVGWTHNGIIDVGTEETLEFKAMFVAPPPKVKPGEPIVCDTAEEATNMLAQVVFTPSEDVAAVLTTDTALQTYREMFELDVAPTTDGKWAVEAFLKPGPWTNVVESAQAATRQLPLADIAALPLNTPTNVTVTGCGVPGFYYTLYGAAGVRALPTTGTTYGAVLCGTNGDVEFSGVVKPSETAGFFSIGARAVRE